MSYYERECDGRPGHQHKITSLSPDNANAAIFTQTPVLGTFAGFPVPVWGDPSLTLTPSGPNPNFYLRLLISKAKVPPKVPTCPLGRLRSEAGVDCV